MEEACAPASLNALDMLYIYNDFMSRYDGYTVRNPHDSELLLEEFSMPGASSVRIGDAYALYYSDAKTAFVSEIAGGDIMPMIRHLCNGFQSVNAPLPIGHPLSKYGCSKRAVFNVIKPLDEAELTVRSRMRARGRVDAKMRLTHGLPPSPRMRARGRVDGRQWRLH